MSSNATEPTLSDVMVRLDEMDKRLTERMDRIDGRLDGMNRRINSLENRQAATEQLLIRIANAVQVPANA